MWTVNCVNCGLAIEDKQVVFAINRFWHISCLKCVCCGVKLAEMGRTLYFKKSLLFCQNDYVRIFGATGECCRCGLKIEPMDWVMKIKPNSKKTSEEPKTLHCHLQCFSCQICDMRFCVGDPFYFVMGKIVCSKDRFSTNLAS